MDRILLPLPTSCLEGCINDERDWRMDECILAAVSWMVSATGAYLGCESRGWSNRVRWSTMTKCWFPFQLDEIIIYKHNLTGQVTVFTLSIPTTVSKNTRGYCVEQVEFRRSIEQSQILTILSVSKMPVAFASCRCSSISICRSRVHVRCPYPQDDLTQGLFGLLICRKTWHAGLLLVTISDESNVLFLSMQWIIHPSNTRTTAPRANPRIHLTLPAPHESSPIPPLDYSFCCWCGLHLYLYSRQCCRRCSCCGIAQTCRIFDSWWNRRCK